MKKFVYRHPRHRIDVPVYLYPEGDYSVGGRCTDVSAEGLGVRINDLEEVGEISVGKVLDIEFLLGANSMRAKARVEYCEEDYYGMSFQCTTSAESIRLQRMIQAIQRIK